MSVSRPTDNTLTWHDVSVHLITIGGCVAIEDPANGATMPTYPTPDGHGQTTAASSTGTTKTPLTLTKAF